MPQDKDDKEALAAAKKDLREGKAASTVKSVYKAGAGRRKAKPAAKKATRARSSSR